MRYSFVAIVVAGILAATGGFVSAGPTESQADLGPAIAAQERHTPQLMRQRGVVGTAVGLNDAGRPVVLIFTESSGVRGLPGTLDGVPVIVQVTGRFFALHHACGHSGGPPGSDPQPTCTPTPTPTPGGGGDSTPTPTATATPIPDSNLDPTSEWPRPVPIAVSTGHPDITAGTIGARVKKADGSVYALSDNHVYADENRANPGDNVLQPGPYDGGVDPDDAIGTLSDFEPIKFDGSDNTIDAAIALSSATNLGQSTPAGGYGTPKSQTATASINLRVQKYGRTTGLTESRVWAINATVNVGYDSGVARFVNQLVIRGGGFSAGGDSGSLIVVDGGPDDRKPVGLLFAGSVNATIANPIDAVLTRFGVTVDGD